MDIKIRYTWRRKSDGHIWQDVFSIEELELGKTKGGRSVKNVPTNTWELVARDLWTGLKDILDNEIFVKDYDFDGQMIDYCPSCAGFQFFQIDIPSKDICFCNNCEGNYMLQDHIREFKIVGNLHNT